MYLEYSLADRQTNVRQGLQFIDEQLPDLQQEVDTLQAELQQFRQNYNFTEPEIHFNQLAQKAATLEQQRFQLQQEMAQAQTRLQSLQGGSGALAALENSETYQQVLGQLRSVEANIAKESTRFQEGSLNIQVLREERQNLLPILQQEAERVGATQVTDAANQLRILQARIPSLNQAQAEVEQSFQNLAVLNRLYTDLQRRLGISTEALTELLARRQALQVQAHKRRFHGKSLKMPPVLTYRSPPIFNGA